MTYQLNKKREMTKIKNRVRNDATKTIQLQT